MSKNWQDIVEGLYEDVCKIFFTWDKNCSHNQSIEGCSLRKQNVKYQNSIVMSRKVLVMKTTLNLQK